MPAAANASDAARACTPRASITGSPFAEYAVNHINTLARVPDTMSDAEATLVVTAGTSMYGLTELGGLVAGESVVVIGPGPIGLLAVAVAKALGASPVILTGTRARRLAIGKELGADRVINVAADYVVECAGTEATVDQAIHMTNRGGKICLAAFPHDPVMTDLPHLVKNNIYVYGIRGEGRSATRRAMALMAEKRFDATKIHTHTFPLTDLPTALRYARDRVDDAIKVVVTTRQAETLASAAAE
jgi:threonine dehydrogenase-like Zn-dependent dehydrogenase